MHRLETFKLGMGLLILPAGVAFAGLIGGRLGGLFGAELAMIAAGVLLAAATMAASRKLL